MAHRLKVLIAGAATAIALVGAGCTTSATPAPGSAGPPSGTAASPSEVASASESEAPEVTASPSASATPSPIVATASPTDLAGTWSGTWTNVTPDHSGGTFTLILTQNGSTLRGSIAIVGTICLSGGKMTGSVKGDTIKFGVVQGQVSVAYTGKLSGSTMTGTYATPCGNAKGSWSATRM